MVTVKAVLRIAAPLTIAAWAISEKKMFAGIASAMYVALAVFDIINLKGGEKR